VHNFKNYAQTFHNTQTITTSTNLLLSSINLYPNNLRVNCDSKTFSVYSNLFQKFQTLKNIKTPSIVSNLRFQRNKLLSTLLLFLKHSNLKRNTKNTQYNFYNAILTMKPSINTHTFLSPKVISAYIVALLTQNPKYNVNFGTKGNLQIGIVLLLKQLLKPFKKHLLGVKIVCSGK